MRKWLSGLMGLVFLCGMCGSVSLSFAQDTQQHGRQSQAEYQQVRWKPKLKKHRRHHRGHHLRVWRHHRRVR